MKLKQAVKKTVKAVKSSVKSVKKALKLAPTPVIDMPYPAREAVFASRLQALMAETGVSLGLVTHDAKPSTLGGESDVDTQTIGQL